MIRFNIIQCLVRPNAVGLAREFANYGPPGTEGRAPCRRSRDHGIGGPRVKNQCAVRMSVALCRNMNYDIFGSYQGLIHSARCCAGENKYPHITSSAELVKYLRNTLGFNFQRCSSDSSDLTNRKGIIFFRNCFNRDNGSRGSHIDYWNGNSYTNAATGTGAESDNLPLFHSADRILFYAL